MSDLPIEQEVAKHLLAGNQVALIGESKTGKTQLLHSIIGNATTVGLQNYRIIYIDLQATPTAQDLYKSLAEQLHTEQSTISIWSRVSTMYQKTLLVMDEADQLIPLGPDTLGLLRSLAQTVSKKLQYLIACHGHPMELFPSYGTGSPFGNIFYCINLNPT
jgi:Cdc6-like AAA superfamily ATPase